MSLEETKQLLRTHRIFPNKVLGQNFMVEPKLYPKLCSYAELKSSDVVLDAGAGFGFLTRYLAERCKRVVAVEKDPQVASVLREQVQGLDNVAVVLGDVLRVQLPDFDKAISIPPYYLSSDLVEWLLNRKVACAVLIVQKEFATRLVAPVGSDDYGWLTVLTFWRVEAELFDAVPKGMFYPQPQVDSIIVRLKTPVKKPFTVQDEALFTQLVKWLFTQRNKKLAKPLAQFAQTTLKLPKKEAENFAKAQPLRDKRVRDLSPKEFGDLANALTK
jgi:16S rRNA (adenine1518-N6/adenine1519-N6)-dimethyltransferase